MRGTLGHSCEIPESVLGKILRILWEETQEDLCNKSLGEILADTVKNSEEKLQKDISRATTGEIQEDFWKDPGENCGINRESISRRYLMKNCWKQPRTELLKLPRISGKTQKKNREKTFRQISQIISKRNFQNNPRKNYISGRYRERYIGINSRKPLR